MSDETVEWITVNGAHVPIKEGQSKDEAIRDHFGKEPPTDKGNVKARLDAIKNIKSEERKPLNLAQATEKMNQAGEAYKTAYAKWNALVNGPNDFDETEADKLDAVKAAAFENHSRTIAEMNRIRKGQS
jgi:hypothetical protein